MLTHATKKLFVRVFEGTVLVFLVVMAAYVSMGRILINTVDRYTEDFENILSSSLNIPVSIVELSGTWTYLDPKITLSGFQLGESVSPAVDIDSLIIEFDTLASMRQGKIVICGIEIAGLQLTLTQLEGGAWKIEGLPKGETEINLDPLLDAILHLDLVRLSEIQINLRGEDLAYNVNSINGEPFELGLEEDVKTLSWPLSILNVNTDEVPSRVHLLGRYKGDPRDSDFESELFFNLPSLNISNFLPSMSYQDTLVDEMLVRGKFWLISTESGLELTGTPILESLVLENPSVGKVKILEDIELELLVHGSPGQDIVFQFSKISGNLGDQAWRLKDFTVAIAPKGKSSEIAISLPQLSIGNIVSNITHLGSKLKLLDPNFLETLVQINPQGNIENFYLYAAMGEKRDLQLNANLSSLSLDPHEKSLSISHLDGFVSLGRNHGYFDIHNDEYYEAHYPALFPDLWAFDSTHARVKYDYENDDLKISSGLVEVIKEDLAAYGRFQINLPKQELAHTWGLELGIRNVELLDSFKYLPYTVSEDVHKWLGLAVIDGLGRTSGMVFHGSLNRKTSKDEKAFEIYFDVEDTIFQYDFNWPRFDDLSATIYVGNKEISSDNANAQVFESRVVNSTVRVPIPLSGVIDTVLVDGTIKGSVADALRILNETPLLYATNKMAETWEGNGLMDGVVSLNVPLGPRANEISMVDLKLKFSDAKITMPEYDIFVDQISGDFQYETMAGVSSQGFTGRLFDEAITGIIKTIGDPESGMIDLSVQGHVDVKSLYNWTGQPLLTRGEGKLSYDSTLHVPYGDRSEQGIYVDAVSDLRGVKISMPEPLGKVSDEAKIIEYSQVFLDPVSRIAIKFDEKIGAELQIMDEVLTGGRVHFGAELMGVVTFDNLKVSGAIDTVVFEEWDEMIIDLQGLSDVSLEGELAEALDVIAVDVNSLNVYGFEIEKVLTSITRETDAWKVNLNSEMLAGDVRVPDANLAPLDIKLDYLIVESSGDSEDPLEEVIPTEVVSANVQLAKLMVEDEDYGSWSFDFSPLKTGARINNIIAQVKGFELSGDGEVTWKRVNNEHQSGFKGKVAVADLANSLEQWGYASSMEGQDFNFEADVTWPGTPAMADLDIISGDITLQSGSGRFVQAETDVGALKLLGIFDFASLAKRFRLDFSDVVKSGFTFSNISGKTRFSHGLVDVTDPIVIEGSSTIFKVAGSMDLENEVIDSDMIVTLPVNRNLPWYAAYSAFVVGPLTGAGVFLAQKIFKNQIDTMSSAKYRITGTIEAPVIEFQSIFDASIRETPSEAGGFLQHKIDTYVPEKKPQIEANAFF